MTSSSRASTSSPPAVTSRKKLNALVAAMQQLGDLPTPFDTEQLALQGVTKLGD